MAKGGPKKGSPKTGGRKAGTPNKVSKTLKEAIIEAANLAGGKAGMTGYLLEQAEKNPGPFMSLLAKVMPLQLSNDPDNPVPAFVISFIDPNAEPPKKTKPKRKTKPKDDLDDL